MRYSFTIWLFVAVFACLGGCGQTGPLYMPTEDANAKPPPAAADSTPQSNETS